MVSAISRDRSEFVDENIGHSNEARNYLKHWRLYNILYVLSVFVYIASAAFLVLIFTETSIGIATIGPGAFTKGTTELLRVVSIAAILLINSTLFLILYIIFQRGKEKKFNTIDALSNALAVAIRRYEAGDVDGTIDSLQSFREIAKNKPPFYPWIPLPQSSSPFYHDVVDEIDAYVTKLETTEDVSRALDDTFDSFVDEMRPRIKVKRVDKLSAISAEVSADESITQTYPEILVDSFGYVDIDRDRVILAGLLSVLSITGILVFVLLDEDFGMLITMIFLTLMEIYSAMRAEGR